MNSPLVLALEAAFVLIGLAFAVGITVWRLKRRIGVRQLARTHGFQWLDHEVADGLYLHGTSLPSKHGQVVNSILGKLGDVDFTAFDLQYMIDERRQVTQTVVAFRNEGALECKDVPSAGQKDLHIEPAGKWVICYMGWTHVNAKDLLPWAEQMHGIAVQLVKQRAEARS